MGIQDRKYFSPHQAPAATSPTIIDDGVVIVDSWLGTFRRLGETRAPRVGEYYLAKNITGVCRAAKDSAVERPAREILVQIDDTKILKGGLT
jgi:hypothetical protein